jgi:hypothetical protein
MPSTTRPPMARTAAGAAYYLARPATWWLTAARRPRQPRAGQHRSPGKEAGQ